LFFSLLATFVIVEPFFRAHVRSFTITMQESLEPCYRPLAQISKKGYLPHDYVAILGDSYAEGAGDWYIRSNRNKHLPFQASHLLHERTGRDAVTFGSSVTGPERYVLANLPSSYIFINKMAFLSMEKPKDIIIYFYEGNDINDSLHQIRMHLSPTLDLSVVLDPEKIESYLRDFQKHERHFKRAAHFNVFDNLQSAIFLFRSFINLYKVLKNGSDLPNAPARLGTVNKVFIGGRIVPIADELHSPGLELSEQQMKVGILVYKKCIEILKEFFPDARYGILYVPSPLSVYRLAGPQVSIQPYEGPQKLFPSAMVAKNSDKICGLVSEAAKELNIPFVDTRPRLRRHTQDTIIHGPYDWKHFNRTGYEIFTEDLQELLKKMD
jgi:hypothetical protein